MLLGSSAGVRGFFSIDYGTTMSKTCLDDTSDYLDQLLRAAVTAELQLVNTVGVRAPSYFR